MKKHKLIHLILVFLLLLCLIPQTAGARTPVPVEQDPAPTPTVASDTNQTDVFLPLVAQGAAETPQPTATPQPQPTPTAVGPAPAPTEEPTPIPPPTGPRIELNLLGVVLTKEGEAEVLEATIYDESNNVVPGTVTWSENDPDNVVELQLVSENSAQVIAISTIGSAMVTARYEDLQRSVSISIAPLNPGARRIDHRLVVANTPGPSNQLFLARTPETEAIQVNDVLVSNPVRVEQPGFVVRVTSVTLLNDTVVVGTSQASLPDAFSEFYFNFTGDPIRVRPAYPATGNRAGGNSMGGIPFEEWCEVEYGNATAIDISLLQFSEEPFTLTPKAAVWFDWTGVYYALLTYELTTDLKLTGPTVSATLDVSFGFECEIELSTVGLGDYPISGLPGVTITPSIGPSLGIRGDLALNGSITLQTVELSYQAQGTYGVEYVRDATAQWRTIDQHVSAGPQVTGPTLTIEPPQLEASLTPFLKGLFGVQFKVLGQPVLNVDLIEATLNATGGITVPVRAILYPPPDERHHDPDWQVDAGIQFDLALAANSPLFPPGVWGEPPTVPDWLNFTLYSYTATLGQAPGFATTVAMVDTTRVVTVSAIGSFGWLERAIYEGKAVDLWALPKYGTQTPFLMETGVLDANGQVVFALELPTQGEKVCSFAFEPHPDPFSCTLPPRPEGQAHWYALHSVHQGRGNMIARGSEIPDPGTGGLFLIARNTAGECIAYAARDSLAEAIILSVSATYPEVHGTLDVTDFGTRPIDAYNLVAVVHDRIFDPVGLVYQTNFIINVPRLPFQICSPP